MPNCVFRIVCAAGLLLAATAPAQQPSSPQHAEPKASSSPSSAAPHPKKIKVYLIGDSTMSMKEVRAYPETGWGMPFAHFFDPTVTVDNRAKNGRSTKTFLSEGRWQSVADELKEGDYVFIQFGHNDESKEKTERYTTPEEYKNNLARFISETQAKRANPILLTPVARRKFDASGHIMETHEIYSNLARSVAKEQNVPLIDLDKKGQALLQQYGEENSKLLFDWLEPGEHPNYPEGKQDNTHFNELGARKVAELVLVEMKALHLGLAERIWFPGHAAGQQIKTLADVLKANSVPYYSSSIHHVDDPITSYATLNTDQEFLIAYYLLTPGDALLHFPLFLARFDKRSGTWQETSLSDLKVKVLEEAKPETQVECIGSALRFVRNGDWYYLDLHWNPSAGCLLILNRDLTVHQTLTGWTAAFFKSGSLVYKGNMVHFASVHPETLFVYDPITNKAQKVYPQMRDPFRKDFSERLAKVIDEKRCLEQNWACDPKDFGSSITFPIEVNDETHSLAFRAEFETEGFLFHEEVAGGSKWGGHQYVYICLLEPLRWRGFSVDDLKAKFGTDSLEQLLKPDKLRRVFATPAPR